MLSLEPESLQNPMGAAGDDTCGQNGLSARDAQAACCFRKVGGKSGTGKSGTGYDFWGKSRKARSANLGGLGKVGDRLRLFEAVMIDYDQHDGPTGSGGGGGRAAPPYAAGQQPPANFPRRPRSPHLLPAARWAVCSREGSRGQATTFPYGGAYGYNTNVDRNVRILREVNRVKPFYKP